MEWMFKDILQEDLLLTLLSRKEEVEEEFLMEEGLDLTQTLVSLLKNYRSKKQKIFK